MLYVVGAGPEVYLLNHSPNASLLSHHLLGKRQRVLTKQSSLVVPDKSRGGPSSVFCWALLRQPSSTFD